MSVSDLLSRLKDLDIKVWLDGEHLKINAPKGTLSPALQSEIVANKAALLSLLKEAQAASTSANHSIPHTLREGNFPLSFAQQRLWFLDQYDPGNTAYTIVKVTDLRGRLDEDALEMSLTEILRRHSPLRTVFGVDENGQPVQNILPPTPIHLPVINLEQVQAEQRDDEARRCISQEVQVPLDLKCGPLFRAVLYRLEPERHLLLVLMHHILSDGWSLSIFSNELHTLYNAFIEGQASPLPELEVQFVDYAAWQVEQFRAETLETKLEFWKQNLKGPLPVLEIPCDHPRPALMTFNGSSMRANISAELIERIGHICNQHGVTPFMFLLAAYKILLYRYTGQEDLIIGTPAANRARVEVERLIGFFVNTLALRTDLSGNPTFLELLARVKETALETFANQDVPFEMIVEAIHPERDTAHNPIFQVFFILQNTPGFSTPIDSTQLEFRPFWFDPKTAKFDLTLEVFSDEIGVSFDFEYNTDLFEAATIERMIGHYQTLLESVCANPNQPISALPLLPPAERNLILHAWNHTSSDYPRSLTLSQLIEAQVDRSPNAIAAQDEQASISFSELDRRANRLAHFLRSLGVGPEVLVALSLPRSIDLLVALLAIHKAGGAYLPLDPHFPPDRLAYMLSDSAAPLLLTHSSLAGRFPRDPARILCLDEVAATLLTFPETRLDPSASPDNLAYALYTSGSTGKPKGVQVLQRGLVNFLCSMQHQPGISASDVLLSVTTLSFDIAGLELYLPLISGARLVLVSSQTASDGARLKTALQLSGASLMQATPATWRLLIAAGWTGSPTFKVLCGGEALPPDLAGSLLERCGQLWNMYGPTETTIWSTISRITSIDGPITIGKPVANTTAYILDGHHQPAPVGVPGELYLGGDGVARGYLNRPDLTAERFLNDPFSDQPGARMYSTGDLARFLPDGRILFVGRNDGQVKVHGVRVELGEITAALHDHPMVKSATVIGRKDQFGDTFLVAYIVAVPGQPLTIDILRGYLSKKLMTAMIPTRYVFLDRLPLTPNGKIDSNALPEPANLISTGSTHRQPQSLVEAKLIQIWKTLLHINRIGTRDDFFDLGGHSMLAVRMFIQIHETFGVNLPLISLFHNPTVEYLASLINQQEGTIPWSSLVEIQPTGIRPPIYCIHGMPGDILWYSRLVPFLNPDQPIWGLESQGLDGIKTPLTTIESMAALYIQEIQTLQPEGPYYLCGYSFGGTVAYEMARQLEQNGHEIGLLAIIDHANPRSGYYRVKYDSFFLKNFLKNLPYRLADLLYLRPDEVYARIRRNLSILSKTLSGQNRTQNREEIEAGELIINAENLPDRTQAIIKANFKAISNYNLPTYAGTVTLLRARGGHLFVSHDPEMGWGKYAKKVDIRIIPGSHLGLFREPNLRYLAEQLQRCLDETLPV